MKQKRLGVDGHLRHNVGTMFRFVLDECVREKLRYMVRDHLRELGRDK